MMKNNGMEKYRKWGCGCLIESTSKCKFVAKLGKMFEKDLIWGKEI